MTISDTIFGGETGNTQKNLNKITIKVGKKIRGYLQQASSLFISVESFNSIGNHCFMELEKRKVHLERALPISH